jgi:hypothetical protein
MARKTLLSEGEIRQFMKLAKIPALGTDQLKEMAAIGEGLYGAAKEIVGDRDEEAEIDDLEGDLDAEDDFADEEADALGADDAEMAAGPAAPEELVMDLLSAIEEWAATHDVDMDVEGSAGDEEEVIDMGMDMDAEEVEGGDEVAFGAEDEVEMGPMMEKKKKNKSQLSEDSGYEESEHDEHNAWNDDDHIEAIEKHLHALKHDRDYEEDHESLEEGEAAIVAEVARRVAARIRGAQQKEQLSEKLAERILQRFKSAK